MAFQSRRSSRRMFMGTGVSSHTADRAIAKWLFFVAALVFLMVLVGGATRLTESGLSMVRWEPLVGTVPPLTDTAWAQEFSDYQQSPQYQKVNKGMSLGEFKAIYWWEWGHRLLGRLIGFAFLLPLVYFMAKGYVRRALRPRLFGLFVLGGLQGALGWFMVKSGLVDVPEVSHFRLAAHLSVAILIYAALLWVGFGLLKTAAPAGRPFWRAENGVAQIYLLLLTVVILQIVYGGFVAGLQAGLSYNTWPLMDGRLVPHGMWSQTPLLSNLFENHTTVQFIHRMLAYLVAILSVYLWWQISERGGRAVREASHFLLVTVALQIVLGISTLLMVVPVWLGVAHQAGALLLVTSMVFLGHRMVKA
ncbi:COX15/CtaA family protein [Govanella unica]|uniref:Heme A synthase n=1 Tax=Govanella unica TaxID=2975056 RepID=A0A9X3TZ34_9PROT|nr:COX15/CtaA family protein [Govania unica]MDA5194109.1 COX15/CtaA family protein [Govania unica]